MEDPTSNAIRLADTLLSDRPSDDESFRLRRMPSNQMPSDEALSELAEQLSFGSVKKREDARKKRAKALKLILRNLIICLFEHNWLTLPSSPSNFADTLKGHHLRSMGFDRRIMEDCIRVLTDKGLMELGRRGFKFRPAEGDVPGKASNFRATRELAEQFALMLYEDAGGWEDDLYDIHPDCVGEELEHHQRCSSVLADYNRFIVEHSYALKGPMSRSFSHFPDRGGRITNAYQNIAQRRIPIRQQTLIDGEPLVEPDFSANHLRMAAFLLDKELPEDPYSELVDTLDDVDRGMVKLVVTQCFGALDRRQLGGLTGKFHTRYIGGTAAKFTAIRNALSKRYPWTEDVFFCDVGAHLQYLEGEMALKMMAWAMAHDVPLLPVHDAYAVPERYEAMTEQAMGMVWDVVMRDARDRNDLLKKACSRASLMYEYSKQR